MPSETKNRFLLLYGSQTGQAKAIADDIQEKSDRYGLFADVHCLSQTEKKFNLERESCIVFVVSTTGDGDAPDTVQKFWRRLHKKSLPDTHLQNLHFSLLGLGDSNYTNFCNCGKRLDRRLDQLGAKRFYPSSWADDGVGLEVAAEPWIDNVLPAVREFLGLPPIDIQLCETFSKGNNSSSSLSPGADNSATDVTDSNCRPDIVAGDAISNMEDNLFKTDLISSNDSETVRTDELLNGSAVSLTSNYVSTGNSHVITQLSTYQQNGLTNETSRSDIRDSDIDSSQSSTEVDSLLFSIKLRGSGLTIPLLPPPYLQITFKDEVLENSTEAPFQNGCPLPSASTLITMATVIDVIQLTADDAVKKALDLTLKFDSEVLQYEPGDSISVICPNPEQEIQRLFQRLGVVNTCNELCEVAVLPETTKKRAAIPPHIPPESTLHHIFSTCIDIRHPPKKAFLRVLVECTSASGEKRRLQELCSKQGATEYTSFIHNAGLSLLDILTAFPSCSPPIPRLLEHLSRLQPRPYSVTSSPLSNPGQLHIVFNVVEIAKGDNCAEKKGVCTGWLESITQHLQHCDELADGMQTLEITDKPKVQISIFGRTSQNFRLPDDLSIPLILIGPGTGVAPFIGFLRHREGLLTNQRPENVGKVCLFFGCRHEHRDFLYRSELERLKGLGIISQLCVSFSRDLQKGDNPRYVQHSLRNCAAQVIELIEEKNAMIYVCGDAKHMARNVNETFVEMYQSVTGLSEKESKSRVMSLRLSRRYLEDVWT